MASLSKTCDVFISHTASDAALAAEAADACRTSGLEAITRAELLPEKDVEEALWEALAESRALVAIVSPSGPTPSMALEIGAAWGWNKPIFAILTDPSMTRMPLPLSGVHVYTVGRIDDVIKAIKVSGQQLDNKDRLLLAKLYAKNGTSVDQLTLDPSRLEELRRRFNKTAGKVLAGERLLSELLRMRKQGALPKIRPARQANQSRKAQ